MSYYQTALFNQSLVTSKSRLAPPREEVSPLVQKAREDFCVFRWLLTKDGFKHRTYPHQLEWLRLLETGQDSTCLSGIAGDNTLILAPRGAAKSTFLTQWCAFQIGIHTGLGIPFKLLYVCFVVDVAMLKSIEIKRIIESPQFQQIFPWCRPSRRWADGIWQIDAKPAGLPEMGEPYTMATAGLTGAVASKRAHLIVLDDLIKSPSAIANPEVRKTMRENWHGIIKPTMFDGGRAVCLGTKMAFHDIYGDTFTQSNQWNTCVTSAIQVDDRGEERSYCEKLYRLETLRKLRKEDPVTFSFQYQNIAIRSKEDDYLDESLIVYDRPPREFDRLAVGCDLSSKTTEANDFTVFILVGVINETIWVLDMRRGRFPGNIDKCDVLINLLMDYGICETDSGFATADDGRITWEVKPPIWRHTGRYCDFYPEAVGYQNSLSADYDRYMVGDLKIWNVSCVPTTARGDKRQKFKSVTGVFQLNEIKFNKYRKFNALVEELTSPSTYDDCIDGLATTLAGLGIMGAIEVF